MKRLCLFDVVSIDAGVDRAASRNKLELLFGDLRRHISAEVAVGNKEDLEALVDFAKLLLLAERKLHVVLGAVVGENVAERAVDGGIDVTFLVKARRGEVKGFQKRRGQLVDDGKIHSLTVEVDDRHFNFHADKALSFLFGRSYEAVVQTAHYFLFGHVLTLQVGEDLIDQLHLFLALDIFVMVLGSRFYQPALAERKKLTEGCRLPAFIGKRLRGNERRAVLFEIMHRAPAVGVRVEVLAVGKEQVELVASRHVADDLVKQAKALSKMQPCAVFACRLVELIQNIEKNALAVGVALLYFLIGIKRRIIEDRAVVNERPATSRAVLSREGVAVFVLHVADGGVADMREQELFGDRLR